VDQQQKFLFYLGHLHAQAAPLLSKCLAECGSVTWMLDGTTEPGTPVFLGVKESVHGILLGSWKIPSENTDDIAMCLQQAATRYGCPNRVLHDLSPLSAVLATKHCRVSPIMSATITWLTTSARTFMNKRKALFASGCGLCRCNFT